MAKLKKECPHCEGKFHIKGYDNHVRTCPERPNAHNFVDDTFDSVFSFVWKFVKVALQLILMWALFHVLNWMIVECLYKSNDIYTNIYKFHLHAKIKANNEIREEKQEMSNVTG